MKKKVFSVAFSGLTLLSSVIPSLASTAHAGSDSTPRASAGMEPENSPVCFDSKNMVFVSRDPNGMVSLSKYALGTGELPESLSKAPECPCKVDDTMKVPLKPSHAKGFFKNRVVPDLRK